MLTQRALIVRTVVALAAVFVLGSVFCEAAEPKVIRETVRCGGKEVALQRYQPISEGRHPVMVLLHGVDGLGGPGGDACQAVARRYASRDYVVLVVSYFDRTGDRGEQLDALRDLFLRYARGAATPAQEEQAHGRFRAWMDAVEVVVAHARRLPGVDGDRVGLVGMSLGGYLALATAADRDLKLSVVVELFGGLPRPLHARAKNLPPTLILHGDADPVVPVAEARKLESLLREARRPCEVKIYEGAGHIFSVPNSTRPDLATAMRTVGWMNDADRRTTAFLETHLKPSSAQARR